MPQTQYDSVTLNEQERDLLEAYAAFNTEPNYQPGDLIRWKAGMRNRKFPEYLEPVVCLCVGPHCVEENPRTYSEDDGSPYVAERKDLIFGTVRNQGQYGDSLLQFHCDARRFTKYEP